MKIITPSGTPSPIPIFAAGLRPELIVEAWVALVEEELDDDDDLTLVVDVVDIIEEEVGLETTEGVDDEAHDATEGSVTPSDSQSWSAKLMVAVELSQTLALCGTDFM